MIQITPKNPDLPMAYWVDYPCERNAYFELLTKHPDKAGNLAVPLWDERQTPVERLAHINFEAASESRSR